MLRKYLRIVAVGSWLDLRANPLSGFLTGLSLVVGALSVIGIGAATTVVNDALIAQAEIMSGRATTVGVTSSEHDVSVESAATISEAQSQLDSVGVYSFVTVATKYRSFAISSEETRGSETPQQVFPLFTSGNRSAVYREPVIEFDDSAQSFAPNITINESARSVVGNVGSCPSVQISVTQQPVTMCIRRVIVDGSKSPQIYVPLDEWFRVKPEPLTGVDIAISVHSGHSAGSMTEAVALLAQPLGRINTDTIQRVDTVASLETMRATVSGVLAAIGLVSAALSALGIVNIGLAQSRERARDIAIRRAYGATRMHVFGEVVGSMLFIGTFAAAVAGVIGYIGFTALVPTFVTESSGIQLPTFPLYSLVGAFVVNLGTVVLGSIYPAIRASSSSLSPLLR